MVRLQWLKAHVAVPAVHHFVRRGDDAWLFTEAVAGPTLYEALASGAADRNAVIDAAALFLRRLHAIPVDCCPFTSDHRFRLGAARERLVAGLVDVDDFDDERQGMTAEAVWGMMTALLPIAFDPVVTHGDFSLDNLIWRNGEIAACIDVGRAGVADRYQDIAILWNCLGEFGTAARQRMLSGYGIEGVDRARMDFHLMLDEFF